MSERQQRKISDLSQLQFKWRPTTHTTELLRYQLTARSNNSGSGIMTEDPIVIPKTGKPNKILIVDDIFFNQQAMLIQLKIHLKMDVDEICC